jgi:hypothetical protein
MLGPSRLGAEGTPLIGEQWIKTRIEYDHQPVTVTGSSCARICQRGSQTRRDWRDEPPPPLLGLVAMAWDA